ncbi:arylamine N-acetyltransferase [Thalassobacillus devorans]|uniref:Arylamine N-acetyltransferase n=1 Tax=Thalassobacillus devorans TaxID=279813 RepID=A0ABQ1NI65_9BACI|nr:arylamine N-acetyltransferase [Thalassobacillus devorans]NIK27458.1 N-hydroxyarylamine O-acetyltransferase [Thalassobacillus devorans]GGC77883.1 arylamine N-acetyltransferase [Thalassobacillus devorans]
MTECNDLFRKRIGMAEDKTLTMSSLGELLEKTACTFPFENARILKGTTLPLTKENLVSKLLKEQEGGVCYELNPLLYFFLLENGFDVQLVRGEVFVEAKEDWTHLGRTHVAIILEQNGVSWLVDTGFGGNVPLRPVPLTGETVSSGNGQFRVKQAATEYGNYLLEMKVNRKQSDWQIGYTFDTTRPVNEVAELNEVQEIIETDDNSPFNKNPLAVKLTNRGSKTLSDSSYTEWIDGKQKKSDIDKEEFRTLAKEQFGIEF